MCRKDEQEHKWEDVGPTHAEMIAEEVLAICNMGRSVQDESHPKYRWWGPVSGYVWEIAGTAYEASTCVQMFIMGKYS